MKRSQWTTVAAVLLTAAAVGGIQGVRANGPTRPVADTTAADVSAGERLVARLEAGRARTVHARYAVKSLDAEISQGTFSLEVWRKAPKVRHDSFSQAYGQKVVTTAVRTADGGPVTRCVRYDTAPWECATAQPAAGEFDTLVERVRAAVRGAYVSERSERLGGRSASCFDIRGNDSITVCVDADGVPLLVGADDMKLELLELNGNVRDADFATPAN